MLFDIRSAHSHVYSLNFHGKNECFNKTNVISAGLIDYIMLIRRLLNLVKS